ncbi:MAG: hypothetical protein ACXQTP_04935 [Candidatus Methanofastidiosia archaeon]
MITEESPLFVGRTKRGVRPITSLRFNQTIKRAAKKAELNGDNKYGTMRTHCLRKFFITQLTNHGVEDKIINFFICHKIPDIDRVYWSRQIEQLRRIYEERQRYLNPINGKKHTFDLKKLKGIIAKIKEMDAKIDDFIKADNLKNVVKEIIVQELKTETIENEFDSKIVTAEKEIIELSNQGYNCQSIGTSKWLMRKRISNVTFKVQ